LLQRCDILFLQEHWLSVSQMIQLNDIHGNFLSFSVCGFSNERILLGRPYGGCAILCRKSLNASFQLIECDSKGIVAVGMKSEETMNIFINVYMPCEDMDSTEDFVNQLAHLCDILDRYPDSNIIIGGDLNVDFNRTTTHTALLRNFIHNRDLICDCMLPGEERSIFHITSIILDSVQ